MLMMQNLTKNITQEIASFWSAAKVYMFKHYGENPGKMLVHTGTLGWILSSLAQIGAVAFNDKLSTEQKSFLIPQELADACVNILSFYLLTNTVKNIGSKLVSTGKLRTRNIKKFIEKNALTERVGKLDFDIANPATYGKNTESIDFSSISNDYKSFKNGIDVITSIAGSVISCNIVTPIIRNEYAAKRQKETMAAIHKHQMKNIQHPKGISLEDYQQLAAMKFANRSMRV